MLRCYVLCLLLLSAPLLPAEPAPWYRWHSTTADAVLCSQTSPGAFWERADTPYKDARCTILLERSSRSF